MPPCRRYIAGCLCAALATAVLAGCGQAAGAGPGPEPALVVAPDAAAAPIDAPGPEAADLPADAERPSAEVPERGSVEEAFGVVLAALAARATRPIRDLVPQGGTLVLSTIICRKPIYGVGNCHEERAQADRRRVRDEQVARWQELMAAAAASRADFAAADLPAACHDCDGGRVECSAVVRFGTDECRGDLEATVSAVFRWFEGKWYLFELGYREDILVCE